LEDVEDGLIEDKSQQPQIEEEEKEGFMHGEDPLSRL
jgi:hypothetical protein